MPARAILHIDMDAFYASIEQRDAPQLRGQPVLVGGIHRGVVAAASYESRKFGIHSAMAMSEALRRCPHAIVVPPRYTHYSAVSRNIFAIFHQYTPLVEGLSLDEAFLDVTDSRSLFGDGATIARAIQREIHDSMQLTASAGVAPCKFIAKIASDLRKPHGLVEVREENVQAFLNPLPIEKIWGVGKVGAQRLHTLGFRTMQSLAEAHPDHVQAALGEWGMHLRALARGEDDRPVIADADAKSISAERTFAVDLTTHDELKRGLLEASLRVANRLGQVPCCGRVVQVKLKYADFKTEIRRQALREPISDPDTLYEHAVELLSRFVALPKPVRLVGVGVTDLQQGAPPTGLFPDPMQLRRQKLEATRAAVTAKFGSSKLTRASLLTREPDPFDDP